MYLNVTDSYYIYALIGLVSGRYVEKGINRYSRVHLNPFLVSLFPFYNRFLFCFYTDIPAINNN